MSKKSWKKCLFIAVVVLGAAIIVWSVLAAMSSVGISIGMAAPAAGGIMLISWAVWHLKFDRPLFKPKWLRALLTVCVCVGIAAILVLETLMMAAAGAVPEKPADTVIVLGCGIFPDGRLTISLKNRLDAAYDYLDKHPDTIVIVSGGQGDNEPVSEAAAMQSYLISRGIEASRILTESKSTSTEENLEFSLKIMQEERLGTDVAVVTSDYHIYRALQSAKELGLTAYGIPSPTPWRVWLSCHVREWLAIVKTALLPNFDIKFN